MEAVEVAMAAATGTMGAAGAATTVGAIVVGMEVTVGAMVEEGTGEGPEGTAVGTVGDLGATAEAMVVARAVAETVATALRTGCALLAATPTLPAAQSATGAMPRSPTAPPPPRAALLRRPLEAPEAPGGPPHDPGTGCAASAAT